MAKATIRSVATENPRKKLWDLTMGNIQTIGNKNFAFVPRELMFIDPRFQRTEISKGKVNQLARNWDNNKLDPLKGSLHPEDCLVSVLDGGHRLTASEIIGLPGLVVEIVQGLPEDPEQRLQAEATIFATQMDDVSALTPVQKHRANVLRGIAENIIVEELIEKYHIELKHNPSHGRVTTGQLAGFTMALQVAKVSGKNMLDTVFNILCESRWDAAHNGLSASSIHMTYNILRLHPLYIAEISEMLISMFTEIAPDQLFAQAYAKYPKRMERERILLHVEDIVCENLGITRTYDGGNLSAALARVA